MEGCNSTRHYNGHVPNNTICAGYTDSDKTPCYVSRFFIISNYFLLRCAFIFQNDEGAPLMCFSDTAGTWELHGLLSYHGNCGRNRHPALYSSIDAESRKWILNTIGLKVTTNQRIELSKE